MIQRIIIFCFVLFCLTSCTKKIDYLQTKDNIRIPYDFAFLKNLAPNCDSAMIFMKNNVVIDRKSKFAIFPDNYTSGHIRNVSQFKKEYNVIYGIEDKSDILMYINPQCLGMLDSNELFNLFADDNSNLDEWKMFLTKQTGHIEVEFDNIWGGALTVSFNKHEIGVYTYTKIQYSHPSKRPVYSIIKDAYLENRTLNCDSAYIYSKRNIKPLKINSKISSFSKTVQAKIYIPGIDPSHSKHENLEKAQLERLFIRLDCLVGMSSNEIFNMFCPKDEIQTYQKWEKSWPWSKKRLEVKFKGFPSKGIFMEFDDEVVVNSGIIE